ncbi:molybdenum cofactor biosynthesis protein MoaE [Mycobacterium tuberculosis]
MANVVAEGAYPYCRLTDQPLSVDEVLAAVSARTRRHCHILGTRDHNAGHDVTRLFYEAYPPMVIRTLMSIIGRCEDKAEGVRVAVAHRTGELQIGDAAVVIGASVPHRAGEFDAARMCIELLKQEVPIWKKEFSSTGAEWVGDRP